MKERSKEGEEKVGKRTLIKELKETKREEEEEEERRN